MPSSTRWGRSVPLLTMPDVVLVKGFYDRILDAGDVRTTDGGRVTKLVARPLLNL